MKISLDWLSEFVSWPSTNELLEGLTRAGIEVESVQDPLVDTRGVVVAEVRAVESHPKADKLRVCDVFDGTHSHSVVCGASNAAVGERVAFAGVGARLGDFEITSRKLRGVESSGMLCSREELGLEAKSLGIWLLPKDTGALGQPLFEAFPVAPLVEVSITPNRPDLLSHQGIAREVAALFGTRMINTVRRATDKGAPTDTQVRVLVDAPKSCRKYVSRVVTGIRVGPSPSWLKERLERLGLRSINNVVDATNYVLMELGHPLHAFDLSRLRVDNGLPTIKVRDAREGERLTTLDGVERILTEDDLVVADSEVALALAGIMGGASCEVQSGTTGVLLEAAWFDPARVRSTCKRLGLHTEASHRFERGTDLNMLGRSLDRCAQLIVELAGGEIGKGTVDVSTKSEPVTPIRLKLDEVQRQLGVEIKSETVVQLLEPLEIRCTGRHGPELHFEAPSFRHDLTEQVDLIEEIARRYGYDAIEDTLPSHGGPWVAGRNAISVSDVARHALLGAGMSESVNYGLGSPQKLEIWSSQEGAPLCLLNPLGEEFSALRTTLIPGLLESLSNNIRSGQKKVRLFEMGATFHPSTSELSGTGHQFYQRATGAGSRPLNLPREQRRVGLILWGNREESRWFAGDAWVDFSDLTGVLEILFDAVRVRVYRRATERAGTHPLATAELRLVDHPIGWVGQLHPDLLADYSINGPVFAAEVSLTALEAGPHQPVRAGSLSKFPSTRRDVALLASQDLASAEITDFLRSQAGGKLGPHVVEDVYLFDVYRGKGIPKDRVSLAFAIEYRHGERTLKDEEVNEAFSNVLKSLEKRFPIEVRS